MSPKIQKVILFIVEGASDKAALQTVISQLIDTEEIDFHVVRSDMTTSRTSNCSSARKDVNQLVRWYMGYTCLQAEDFLLVVQLMDTDGAFVPESAIEENPAADGFEYTEETISAQSREAVIKRNNIKKQNMLELAHMGKTYKNIPYEAYYCSRNLEHVLYDVSAFCSDDQKMKLADAFHRRYDGKPMDLLNFLSKTPPAVPSRDYKDSWKHISEPNSLCSLQRGCNLHILLQRLVQRNMS